jgi:perosamine synthetase
MIPLFYPYTGAKKDILNEIEDTLNTRWWGQGPKVERFEKMLSEEFGYKYPVFVNSGTSALELAYHLIGLKAGDEVIVPVLDCTAGQMALKRQRIKIVFADIERKTFNIDPKDVERKITPRTRAIVGTHLGGIPFSSRIYDIGRRLRIPIITDASQHHVPTRGNYICYSFQAIKHITTTDGGMLVLTNQKEYRKAKLLRWFGIDRERKAQVNFQAWERRKMTFDVEEAGYKFQPTDIDACFGIASLPHLKKVIRYRQDLMREYKRLLSCVSEVRCVAGGSAWLFGIVTEARDDLADHLLANGVECNLIHLRNDIYAVFGSKRQNLPNMDYIEPRYLYLPLNPAVRLKDVRYVCTAIAKFFQARASG